MNYKVFNCITNVTFCALSFHSDHEDTNSCLTSKSQLDKLNFIHRMLYKDMY